MSSIRATSAPVNLGEGALARKEKMKARQFISVDLITPEPDVQGSTRF